MMSLLGTWFFSTLVEVLFSIALSDQPVKINHPAPHHFTRRAAGSTNGCVMPLAKEGGTSPDRLGAQIVSAGISTLTVLPCLPVLH